MVRVRKSLRSVGKYSVQKRKLVPMETEFAIVGMRETCNRNWCDGYGDEGSPNLTSIADWQSADFRGQHESSAAPFSARADAVPCEGK